MEGQEGAPEGCLLRGRCVSLPGAWERVNPMSSGVRECRLWGWLLSEKSDKERLAGMPLTEGEKEKSGMKKAALASTVGWGVGFSIG